MKLEMRVAANQEDGLKVDPLAPVIFMGLADGSVIENGLTPFETHTVFKLSRVKPHFAFPALLQEASWCFLINTDAISANESIRIQVLDSKEFECAHLDFNASEKSENSGVEFAIRDDIPKPGQQPPIQFNSFFVDLGQWLFVQARFKDLIISEPGEFRLFLQRKNEKHFLGRLIFVFAPSPEFSEEEISAFESDPTAPQMVVMVLGCKNCAFKLSAYASVRKPTSTKLEKGTFYRELPDNFECECGSTKFSLEYLKKGMHGFLRKEGRMTVGDISYVQRYAQSQLLGVASTFHSLIQRESREEAIQKHLEENKVLFARFHAKQFFIKPRILGKFNADFAILDSEGVLTLIEIERANLRLFKKNGHLRSEFNHAYEQVKDWLDEVLRHRQAVIEGMGLKPDQVLSIRGCVIAGREKNENRDHLRRHMSQPRSEIDFLTFDMLAKGLQQIASELH